MEQHMEMKQAMDGALRAQTDIIEQQRSELIVSKRETEDALQQLEMERVAHSADNDAHREAYSRLMQELEAERAARAADKNAHSENYGKLMEQHMQTKEVMDGTLTAQEEFRMKCDELLNTYSLSRKNTANLQEVEAEGCGEPLDIA
mmetsp:Transcript_24341/g.44812  ORF Transcript_24341/g.44812 Transcript_24341/m.44812 type:complete len:147 (+) Transcript_24341:1-441(+)